MVGIALVASWFVAVLFTPFLGYNLLPDRQAAARIARRARDLFDAASTARFRRALEFCVARPLVVVVVARRCCVGSA